MEKIHELNGCSYRVKDKILESNIHDAGAELTTGSHNVLLGNEFAEVEYFNDFTVGNLLELIDNLGEFKISNSMLGTYNFKMTVELNGINGQK